MSVVTWRITLHLEAPTPTAAAVQAFCAVRHPTPSQPFSTSTVSMWI